MHGQHVKHAGCISAIAIGAGCGGTSDQITELNRDQSMKARRYFRALKQVFNIYKHPKRNMQNLRLRMQRFRRSVSFLKGSCVYMS